MNKWWQIVVTKNSTSSEPVWIVSCQCDYVRAVFVLFWMSFFYNTLCFVCIFLFVLGPPSAILLSHGFFLSFSFSLSHSLVVCTLFIHLELFLLNKAVKFFVNCSNLIFIWFNLTLLFCMQSRKHYFSMHVFCSCLNKEYSIFSDVFSCYFDTFWSAFITTAFINKQR